MMRRERSGAAGGGRPGAFRLRFLLAWLLGALLAGPLGAATPAVAAPRVAPNPVHVAKASTGAGQAAGRLTHRGVQAGAPNGRAALVTALEALLSAQDAPPRPGPDGAPAAGPSVEVAVAVAVAAPAPAPARVTPASAPAAVRGRAPPGGGTSAVAGPSFPLPA